MKPFELYEYFPDKCPIKGHSLPYIDSSQLTPYATSVSTPDSANAFFNSIICLAYSELNAREFVTQSNRFFSATAWSPGRESSRPSLVNAACAGIRIFLQLSTDACENKLPMLLDF